MTTQLLIIGAGPGGYTAAFYAARSELAVTLIDSAKSLGGVCLREGCIPSKSLLHAAKILSDAKDAKDIGIDFAQPNIDIDKIRDWKNSVVSKLSNGLNSLCKLHKVNFIQGKASFLDSNTVRVEKHDGGEEHITFEHAILATGSQPASLSFTPTSERILDSSSALDIKDIPKKLLVIGGGYIGLELGTVYAALGSQVSVVEMTPTLLPGVDGDLTRVLERRLKNTFESIKVNTKVTNIEEKENSLSVTLENKDGSTENLEYDKVLLAIGRTPTTEGLGLENTNATVDEKGFVSVLANRQTTDPKIYAIGDITGNPMLAHKAMAEAPVAVDSICGKSVTFSPTAIPAVIFTDPEIAVCGLTKAEAQKRSVKPLPLKFHWVASGKAMTMNRTDGLTKILIDPNTYKILSIGIVGVGAGDLIAEAVLAIEQDLSVEDFKKVIHPHPTLSETIPEAISKFFPHSKIHPISGT